jgi:hypothetical protein
MHDLLDPPRLWTRSEVLTRPCPVPNSAGVYAWYFREIPPSVPTTGCITALNAKLLYVGISPKGDVSSQSLRKRIRYHYRGNAEGSTLRLSLGCLLEPILGTCLRRVGSGTRRTFADGEQTLSEWMERNAFVVWHVTSSPWQVEERLISELSLPLNLDQNQHHPFCATLSAKRREARQRAALLPVWQRS